MPPCTAVDPNTSPLTFMFATNPWPVVIIVVALIGLAAVGVWRLFS